jgi:hypothetical protein
MTGTGARNRAQGWGARMGTKHPEGVASDEVSLEELREFLEADQLDVRADPKFKEELRRKLWELLESSRSGRNRIDPDGV